MNPSDTQRRVAMSPRNMQRRASVIGLLVTCFWASASWQYPSAAIAQDQVRIIDERPFDRLQVKEPDKEEIKSLKLVPLEMKKRRPITKRPEDDQRLVVRLLSRPEQQYQVEWKHIDKLQLYEELVLEEAAALVEQKRFDEAHEYYRFLEQQAPDFPGLKAAAQRCLLVEAAYWHQQERSDQALALLNELHSQNPDFPGLPRALEVVVDNLIERDLAAGKPAAARQLLLDWERKFPAHPPVAVRKEQLIRLATESLRRAQLAFQEKRLREAYVAARASVGVWPLEDAERVLQEIRAVYPVVVVGVRELGSLPRMEAGTPMGAVPQIGTTKIGPLAWSDLRQRRLIQRQLAEPASYQDGRIRYASPLAEWTVDGAVLTLRIREGITWMGGLGPLTSYDVAHSLLEATRNDAAPFRASLVRRIRSVTVADSQSVRVELSGPLPEPGVLLHQELVPWSTTAGSGAAGREAAGREDAAASAGSAPTVGPYRVADQSGTEIRFELRSDYFALGLQQPREITERRVEKIGQAVSELKAGEILALDRIYPWELPALAGRGEVQVVPYPVPTVHFLVAGSRLGNESYRRGVHFGINRQKILTDTLLEKGDVSLGEVLSGPFPRGAGYNEEIAPSIYDPRMLLALTRLAAADAGSPPPLRLAYRPTATATRACRAIREQLTLEGHGVPVELIAIPTGTTPAPELWDLLYVEWIGMDPLADVHALFDSGGLCPLTSPRLQAAVERLATQAAATDTDPSLREIHAIVAEELPILPLWQLREHLAYHPSILGIGDQPSTLYQSIEQWHLQ